MSSRLPRAPRKARSARALAAVALIAAGVAGGRLFWHDAPSSMVSRMLVQLDLDVGLSLIHI